jgi:hypothetical protein
MAQEVQDADPTGRYSTVLLAVCPLPRSKLAADDACIKTVKADRLMTFTNVGKPVVPYILEVRPTLRQFAGSMATMLRALQYFHAAGVYHNDLHASNVMLDPATGVARCIDFGGPDFLRNALKKFNFTLHWSHSPVDMFALCLATGQPWSKDRPTIPDAVRILTKIMGAYYSSGGRHTPHTILERVLFWPVQEMARLKHEPVRRKAFFDQNLQNNEAVLTRALTLNAAYARAQRFDKAHPVWPPLDVFSVGTTGLVGMQVLKDEGLDTRDAPAGLQDDLMQLFTDMVNPVIPERPTAAQAWEAMQGLCTKHAVAIPPAEPMLGGASD